MRKILILLTTVCLAAAFICTPKSAFADDIDAVNRRIASIPKDWPEAPKIGAQAAILMDADSGAILYAKNATAIAYPASTTKLMTALLTLEIASLSDIVTFSQTAVMIPAGSSHIGMRRGEQMLLRECLLGLLLPSANEVANALAEHVGGNITSFVQLMNERAFNLGCVNTRFVNANGLHDEDHYTCCYDLALIMQALATNNTFTDISGTPSYVHHADELLPKDIPMMNTNQMVRSSTSYYNEYVICGKTGHTEESGYNLVIYAEKDGVRLISVVMGCEKDQEYVATQSLLDYGFNYFHPVLPAELDRSLNMDNAFTSSPLKIPTRTASILTIDATDTILLPDNVTFDMLEKRVADTENGKLITYTYQDYPLGTVSLLPGLEGNDDPMYETREEEPYVIEEVTALHSIDGWLLLSLATLLLLFILLTFILYHWRYPRKKRRKAF